MTGAEDTGGEGVSSIRRSDPNDGVGGMSTGIYTRVGGMSTSIYTGVGGMSTGIYTRETVQTDMSLDVTSSRMAGRPMAL